jgi:hypothetical protein
MIASAGVLLTASGLIQLAFLGIGSSLFYMNIGEQQ